MAVVTLPDVFRIESDLLYRVKHCRIQLFGVDPTLAVAICAQIVKISVVLLVDRCGTHIPLWIAATANQSGKQIGIFPATGTRDVVVFPRQQLLNFIEKLSIDYRLVFSFEEIPFIGNIADIKTVPEQFIYFPPVPDLFFVQSAEVEKIFESAALVTGTIKLEDTADNLRVLRNNFCCVFYPLFSPVSERESAPCSFSLACDPAHLCGDSFACHLALELRDRDCLCKVETCHRAGRREIILTDRDESEPCIAEPFEKRSSVSEIAGKTVELPDDQCVERGTTALDILDDLLYSWPVQIFSGSELVINLRERRAGIA